MTLGFVMSDALLKFLANSDATPFGSRGLSMKRLRTLLDFTQGGAHTDALHVDANPSAQITNFGSNPTGLFSKSLPV